MIRVDQFAWQFEDAPSPALHDVSLHVRAGEFVAIAGPSASGKTTLALAMCGLLIGRQAGTARGSVQVGGLDVARTPLHRVAETIGLVQQNPETHFATLTVHDEIAFGLENRCRPPEEIRRASERAMMLLGITHLRERSLGTLSGGEKQRVAVASMIAGQPAALILDEPTASLDPRASRDLFAALADLCRQTGLTVVIIEHKLAQLLPLRPRLICLDGGRIAMDAPDGAAAEACPAWLAGPGPTRTEPARRARLQAAPREPPIVDVSHATVELDQQPILRDVSLRLHPGEVVALLGPNGGGKSTLLHCLLGLVPLAGGEVRVGDIPATPTAISRLAPRVGVVFQNADHQLVADSVWYEALFAAGNLKLRAAPLEAAADRLLERAGLASRRHDHPFRLSWGQKRRLNLISAVLHRPRLLLLDEPFAGQDWENVEFLLDIIDGVVAGAPDAPAEDAPPRGACLMVTHDPRIVQRRCTRVLFMADGRIVLDASVPQAFERLRELGCDVYCPMESHSLIGEGL